MHENADQNCLIMWTQNGGRTTRYFDPRTAKNVFCLKESNNQMIIDRILE